MPDGSEATAKGEVPAVKGELETCARVPLPLETKTETPSLALAVNTRKLGGTPTPPLPPVLSEEDDLPPQPGRVRIQMTTVNRQKPAPRVNDFRVLMSTFLTLRGLYTGTFQDCQRMWEATGRGDFI